MGSLKELCAIFEPRSGVLTQKYTHSRVENRQLFKQDPRNKSDQRPVYSRIEFWITVLVVYFGGLKLAVTLAIVRIHRSKRPLMLCL